MVEIPKATKPGGAGGTEGGTGLFLFGLALAAAALYFFLDSTHIRTGGAGMISGAMGGRGRGGMGMTTSMGIIFVPFFIGVVMLFYNSKLRAGWILTYLGLAIIVVEILSRIRFELNMKTTHLIIMIVMFAAGTGFMLRSYKSLPQGEAEGKSAGG